MSFIYLWKSYFYRLAKIDDLIAKLYLNSTEWILNQIFLVEKCAVPFTLNAVSEQNKK